MLSPAHPPLRDPVGKRTGISFHAYLVRVIWLSVLPLVVLAIYLAMDSVMTTQGEQDREAADLAQNIATAIDLSLNARIGAMQMLAMSPHMDDPSAWEELYQEAISYRGSFGGDVILADLGMHMLFNTRTPFGTALPLLPGAAGLSAAPAAAASGKATIGDMVMGSLAGEPLVAVAVPVVRREKVTFLLLTIFATQQFQQRLDRVALPARWSLALLDGQNRAIARRNPSGASAGDVDPSGRFEVPSGVSPWKVVVEIPRGNYRAPLLAAGLALITAILGATLASVLGGMLASRRLVRSLESLLETPVPGAPPDDIREFAAMRQVLGDVADQHVMAEATLRESEQRFRRLFHEAPVPLGLVSGNGVVVDINDHFVQLFGYTAADVPDANSWWLCA